MQNVWSESKKQCDSDVKRHSLSMALPHASEINCVRKIHIGKESEGFR